MKKINYEKTFYYSILIFALILPLSRALISLFVIFLPVLWLMQGDFKRKIDEIKSNKLLMSIVLFILWGFITILWSENYKNFFHAFRMMTYLFTIFVIATSVKKEQINSIISAFLIGIFISEVIAYGVFFELWTFKHATPENPSPFMMHIDYSVFLAFASMLLLNRLFSKKYNLKEKAFFLFFFLTVTGNLFLSSGRTGQVALIAGIFVLSIIHFKITLKSFFISVSLICVIFFSAYNLSNTFQSRVHASISSIEQIANFNLNSSWGVRVAFWITTYDSFKENPFGSGIGEYKNATKIQLEKNNYEFINEYRTNYMSHMHPHNQYLLVILQMGIVGLLLFFNIMYQLFKHQNSDKELKELSILFATVFFVSCLAEPLLIKQFTLVLFVLFVGLFASSKTTNTKTNS